MSALTAEPLEQYPLHRDKYLSLETPVNGVGCYVQLCEARLTKYIDRERKLHDQPVPDSEPFLDKFIRDIYQPLLKSDCKSIVINIDPLSKNSNETLLIDTAKRLLSLDASAKIKIDRTRDDIYIRSTDRVNIIIPDEHVNGCVGRNISFWFIRSTLYDNGLYWFGSDDDDRINQDGVNSLSYFISHYIDPYDHSKVILFDDRYMNKLKRPEQGYTRYAPWSYAFSPEYYDGISFPCHKSGEKFNGDLYIVPFKVYNNTHNQLYGACFQNGKLPEILPVKEYSRDTPTENEDSIHQELTQIIPDYADIFYARTTKPSTKEYKQIKTWNANYLQNNRTSDQWIPLKTFGGSNNTHRWFLWTIVILIIATVVYICIPFNRNDMMKTTVDSGRIVY